MTQVLRSSPGSILYMSGVTENIFLLALISIPSIEKGAAIATYNF